MAPKKKGGRAEAPYGLATAFERGVVFLACTDPQFMAQCAHELKPDLLALPECRLALAAAQALYRDKGRGPTTPAVTIQAVARQRDEGKATTEDVNAVAGLFDIFDGKELPEGEEFKDELVRVLRTRLRFEAALAAVDEHGKEDWTKLSELMTREQQLGVGGTTDIGVTTDPKTAVAQLVQARSISRQSFGIEALDAALGGGVPMGTLTCFMAGPGGAKSMTMSHSAGQLSLMGKHVAIATLEIPATQIMARILANQTSFTIDEILSGAVDPALGARVLPSETIPVTIQDFPAHATTVENIQEWVKTVERRAGRKLDAIFVDYADRLTVSGKVDEKGTYQEMKIVYEKLRAFCVQKKILGVTASQSRARDEKKSKFIDMEHTADSMHKARIVDQFITINFDDDTRDITFFVAKNRYGEGRRVVGPLPTNFACGRVAPVKESLATSPVLRHQPDSHTPIGAHFHSVNQDKAITTALQVVDAASCLGATEASGDIFGSVLAEENAEREPGSNG